MKKNQFQEEEENELEDLLDNINKQESMTNLVFNRLQTDSDKEFLQRLDQVVTNLNSYQRDILGSKNQQLPSYPNKRLIRNFHYEILIGNQADQGILDSTLRDKKKTIDIQLENFRQILNENLEKSIQEDVFVGRIIFSGEFKDNTQLYFYTNEFQNEEKPKPIHLKQMDEYFLFPGKIIAAEFEDKNAKILVLTKIHKFFPASEIMEEEEQKSSFNQNQAVGIIVAAGPLTIGDSLSFTPLQVLINQIKQNIVCCDFLILLGPILSEYNSALIDYNEEYEQLYSNVMEMIATEIPDVKVLIVNSVEDLLSLSPLPQPSHRFKEYTSRKRQKSQQSRVDFSNIQHVGNPAKLDIQSSLQMGIMNSDVFMTMRYKAQMKGQYAKQPQIGMFDSITQQRSFFPVFPNQIPVDQSQQASGEQYYQIPVDQTKLNEELNITWHSNENRTRQKDIMQSDNKRQQFLSQQLDSYLNTQMPDIILAPSRLAPFVHQFEDTLFINPSFLSKNDQSYVHIVHFTNTGLPVQKTLRVDIRKL